MSDRTWTPVELIRWTAEYFGRHQIPSPRLDAEVLLAHVLGTDRMQLYLRFDELVDPEPRARFRDLVRRRAEDRVPVAYLTGVREFWSRPFAVSPATLIPRPDTELLVETTVGFRPHCFADVGTGCGAIAAALLLELPESRALAVDRSAAALAVARGNLQRLGVADRAVLVRGDGLEGIAGPLDAIVSNPPYVPSAQLPGLPPEVGHEPRLALDGGAEGLDVLERLILSAPMRLSRPGLLALEVGEGQARVVCEQLERSGAARVELRKDLAGVERVVSALFE